TEFSQQYAHFRAPPRDTHRFRGPRAANWRNKTRESKKSRALPRFGLLSTVERPAVGPIASQLSFFFSEHEALFCRAREAIMRSALMAALDTSEPSSPSLV